MDFVVSTRQDLTYAVCYTDADVMYTFTFSSFTEDVYSCVYVGQQLVNTNTTELGDTL